jgi:hypothetical protein
MSIVAKFGSIETVRPATCSAAESVGDFVYLAGNQVNGVDTVSKANPLDLSKMPAVGTIIKKISDTDCFVQWGGETPAMFSGLQTGKRYFLGSDAKPSLAPPDPSPGLPARAQSIGIALTADKLYVSTNFRWHRRV